LYEVLSDANLKRSSEPEPILKEHPMPRQTKVFRVFVSSTFSDMSAERHLLQENVFPRLEKYCAARHAKFQAVDLRWGVTETSSLNQKTLEICLNEVARCQRVSPKPNFLILLGNKYGWQPIPTKIPADEWMGIIDVADDAGSALLNEWYKKDENADPAEFVIKPRQDEYEDYEIWGSVESQIKEVLRNAVSQLNFDESQRIKYFTSATHQEIMHGALNPPQDIENPNKHVFAYERITANLPNDGSAEGYIDLVNNQPDTYSANQLISIKGALKDELKVDDHYHEYPAAWQNNDAVLDNPEQFCAMVYSHLESVISEQLDNAIDPEEISHESRLHAEFKDMLVRHFRGRDAVLDTVKDYIGRASDKKTLTVIGESGSGKSSVIAKAIENVQNMNADSVLVYRFLGTSSASSNVISAMQSIAGEIAEAFGTDLKTMAGEGNEKAMHEINGMSEIFRKCLALAASKKPVVVFMDALDQLTDTDNAKALYWLPKELPDNVKLIVSSLPELEARLSDTLVEHLPLLPDEEAEVILQTWFKAIDRKLNKEQHDYIMSRFSNTHLPIYLKMVFEQARSWPSYYNDYNLSDSVEGIINDFIEKLENEHPPALVEHVICYMLSGRYKGLAENEILDILVFDKEFWEEFFLPNTHEDHLDELKAAGRIPIAVWSRLYLDLEPFLTERDADGVPIITFFHRQFNEVLRDRYGLAVEEDAA